MGLPQFDRGDDVYSFVDALEEFLTARKVPIGHAHTYFPYVLKGQILVWYRLCRKGAKLTEKKTRYETTVEALLETFGRRNRKEKAPIEMESHPPMEREKEMDRPTGKEERKSVNPNLENRKRKMALQEEMTSKRMRLEIASHGMGEIEESSQSEVDESSRRESKASSDVAVEPSCHGEIGAHSHIGSAESTQIESVESSRGEIIESSRVGEEAERYIEMTKSADGEVEAEGQTAIVQSSHVELKENAHGEMEESSTVESKASRHVESPADNSVENPASRLMETEARRIVMIELCSPAVTWSEVPHLQVQGRSRTRKGATTGRRGRPPRKRFKSVQD